MSISGQSKTFCLHSIVKPPFKIFLQIVSLLFGDESFFQEIGGTRAINVSLLYSRQIHLNSLVNGASKSLMAF